MFITRAVWTWSPLFDLTRQTEVNPDFWLGVGGQP
jgi:hypothetical protein